MKKKILICSSAFYPENSPRSFRATELAREFTRQGHEVHVLSLSRNGQTDAFCKTSGIHFRAIPDLISKPFSRFPPLVNRILNRLFLMLFEYPDVELMWKYRRMLKNERGYDLLLSLAVPYPVHWGVALAWLKSNPVARVWIADCGDPYMGNEIDSFRKFFYFQFVEKWMFRKCSYITIPIEAARKAYYKEFHSKIRVIPQGFNFEEALCNKQPYIPNQVPTFAYAGSFIPNNRDPRKLLQVLNGMDRDFRFIIYTNMDYLVRDEVNNSRGRIIVHPYVPREVLIRDLSQTDFLINIENSTTTQAPSKLIDYWLAGRPVLSVNGNNPDIISLTRFLERDFSGHQEMNGYEQFDIRTVATSFLNLV